MSRQYLSAGGIVEEVSKGKSLKAYCASKTNLGKVDYAIALQTLKYKDTIMKLLASCNVSATTLDVREGVLLVMVYELLFGEGKIKGGGSVKRAVLERIPSLKQALDVLMVGKLHHSELLPQSVLDHAKIGAFLRVNTVKITMEEGLDYVQKICPAAAIDPEIPSLIALPSSMTSFGQDAWVKEGKLIIQDKASCFPSQVLFDAWSTLPESEGSAGKGDFIDACAAPGNKTSHLATLAVAVNEDSKVYAFEKNPRRAQLLKDRMAQMAVQHIVKVNNTDFLGVDVFDPKYQHVTAILLDPSCSGSGVARSLERAVEGGAEQEESGDRTDRLHKLQSFQIKVIQKAMTFLRVQKIVYSTCSVHKEENEYVVAEILRQYGVPTEESASGNTKKSQKNKKHAVGESAGWRVASPTRLAQWSRRGLPLDAGEVKIAGGDSPKEGCSLTAAQSTALIRCSPEDGTNGFFVSLFERVGSLPDLSTAQAAAAAFTAANTYPTGAKSAEKNAHANGGKKRKHHVAQTEDRQDRYAQDASQPHKQTAYPPRKPKEEKAAGGKSLFGNKFKVQRKRLKY